MKHMTAILLALTCVASVLAAEKATQTPNVLVIPKCAKAPVIDGVIGPDEWTRAAAFTGFQHIFNWMTERQPVIYVTYDDDRIYFAMESRFPLDSKLVRVARYCDHKRVCRDDTLEIFIAPDYENRGDLDYQFLGNSLGVIQDILARPSIGNTLLGWNGNWEFNNTTSPGRWQAEVSMTLAEVGLKPDHDFGLNVCRDYSPYIFTNWTPSGYRNYARATFGGDCPVVQLTDLGPILKADMKAKFAVRGGAKQGKLLLETEVLLEAEGTVIARAKRELDVPADSRVEAVLAANWADKEGRIEPFSGDREGNEWTAWLTKRRKVVTLKVSEAMGRTLLFHTLHVKEGLTDAVKSGPQRVFEVVAEPYPSYNMLRAGVDIYGFEQKDKVKSVGVDIKPVGKEFVVGCGRIEQFTLGYGEASVTHLPLTDGEYEATFRLLDAAGNTLAAEKAAFPKKSFAWEGTDAGLSDDVIPPFTPLQVKGRSVFCWGREYAFGDSGLPKKVVTRDANILAHPVAFQGQADSVSLSFRPMGSLRVVSAKPGLVKLCGYSRAGNLRLESNVDIEYDGMMKFALRLCPDQELTVEKLSLLLPLHDENAVLFHACGESIRMTNRAGFTPPGKRVVWTSKEIPNSVVLGTFIPYFWLGDYDRGFCWMADNDRGWSVDDAAPAVEFVREGKTLTARVNLFSKAKTLRDPVQIVFALMAGPARPEPEGWRLGWQMGKVKLGWFYHAKTFQGYGKPPDMDKFIQVARDWREKTGARYGVNMSPNDLWGRTEENEYYVAEWSPGCPVSKRNDYVMWNLDKLMKDGYIDGLYADDVYPVACSNTITGCGYLRDDGEVQTGYNMFGNREFFKRAATLFRQNGCKHGMLVHMTDSTIMPCNIFWDGKHDNEWGRRSQEDHIDAFPLGEICARTMSRQYGLAASWHTTGRGHGDDLAALCLLHDIIPRVYDMDNRTLPAKLLFGFGETDVEFLGYWLLQPERDPEALDVKMSARVRRGQKTNGTDIPIRSAGFSLLRPHGRGSLKAALQNVSDIGQKTALVVVANLSKEDWRGKLAIPLDKLGLPKDAVAADAEERHAAIPLADGTVRLAVQRENYRLLLLGPKGAFPRDLPPLGAELPGPRQISKGQCDDFDGPKLSSAWKLVASSAADGGIEVYRGRLSVKGADYKFAAAERELGRDNVSVQVRVESHAKHHVHRIGLALLWGEPTPGPSATNRYVFAGPSLKHEKFEYAFRANDKLKRTVRGSPVSLANPGTMHQCSWVKIALAPQTLTFYGSADGKTWTKDLEIPRPEELKGPPSVLRLGKNPDGAEDRHQPAATYDYFDDLVVGTD